MEPPSGSESVASFPVSLSTSATQFFFPEWVTAVFYGCDWHVVKPGSFKEGIATDHGEMAVYQDWFDDELVFVTEPITGYKVKKPTLPE